MIRQTPKTRRLDNSFFSHRVQSILCGLCLSSCLASAYAAGLGADSADQLPLTDSLSHSLLTMPLDVPGGQVLAEHDLAQVLVDLQELDVQALEMQSPVMLALQAAEGEAASFSPQVQIPRNVNQRVQSVLSQALAQLGIPYRWGGTTPSTGFDCSGLVKYVFKTALGIELPRVSRDQAQNGLPVDRQSLTPGDLVFFSRRGKTVNHVGIYLGDGRFVHAPRTGRDVTISNLSGYWYQRFLRARRVPDLHD